MRLRLWLLAFLIGFRIGPWSPAVAETAAEFYKGKLIRVIIG